MRNHHGAQLGKSPFHLIHTIVEILLQQQSTVLATRKSIEADALRAKGTKRQDILAHLDLLCLFISTSMEMSTSPKSATGTSTGPESSRYEN